MAVGATRNTGVLGVLRFGDAPDAFFRSTGGSGDQERTRRSVQRLDRESGGGDKTQSTVKSLIAVQRVKDILQRHTGMGHSLLTSNHQAAKKTS